MLARNLPLSISSVLAAAACWSMMAQPVQAAETDCLVRDPSTMIKDGSTYWIYGTGTGVTQFSSTDRLHWTNQGPVFPKAPDWVASTVPGNKDNSGWAPDIREIGGKYFLYYTYSQFGTNISGIGVAINNSLDPKGWVDQGIVIRTGKDTDYNALDPCIFEDANGGWWMSFGSYFSGIKVTRIDPKTGKRPAGDQNIYPIASHPQSSNNSIEASSVYYHDGYYYLFVNWGSCCEGSKSTYNIRIGRSKSPTGPYLDDAGRDMMDGGGSIFLDSIHDTGSGLPFDDEVGPGHAGILQDGDDYWFSCHYEWARDTGATTVNVFKLTWNSDGWPSVPQLPHSDPITPGLTYKITNNESDLNLYAAGGDAVQESDDGTTPSVWRVDKVSNGFYNIVNKENGLYLSAPAGSKKPGDLVVLVPDAKGPEAQWKLARLGSDFLKVTNKATGLCLDNPGGSHQNGQKIGQWTDNNMPPQQWRFAMQADDAGIVPNASYRLSTAVGGLSIDDPAASHKDGEKIGLWTDNSLLPQRWQINPVKNGEYTIKSQESGLYLTAQPDGSVIQTAENKKPEQQWKIQRGTDGTSKLTNVGTGMALAAPGNPPAKGAKLTLKNEEKNKSQAWVIVRE